MADDYGQEIWQADTDAAHAEAVRRIGVAASAGDTRLDLRDLSALEAIPFEIEILPGLTELWCGMDRTRESPELPYVGLYRLSDISALKSLNALRAVGLSHTPVSDFSVFQGKVSLETLRLNRVSREANWGTLTDLRHLKQLYVGQNGIADFGFLGGLTALEELNIGTAEIYGFKDQPITRTEVFYQLRHMRRLNLSGYQFSDFGFWAACRS